MKTPAVRLFLAVQGVLYLWFLSWDLRDAGDTRWIKYASIVLCFLFAAYQAARGGDRLTAAALAFTLGADAFLLLLDRYYPLGIGLFCIAHLFYRGRIGREGGGAHPCFLLPPALCGLLAALARWGADTAMAAVYALLLAGNVYLSWSCLRGRAGRLLCAGLTLLLCCDVCVGLHNLSGPVPAAVAAFADVGMWLFYLPYQVCAALSVAPERPEARFSHERE